MFKKLMKLEWKETWKLLTFLLLAMILCSLLGGIIISIGGGLCSADASGSFYDNLMIFSMLLGYSAQIVMPLLALLRLCQYFWNSMYSRRGYLTHTLPATKSELVGAKMTVSFLWILLISAAVTISWILLMLLSNEITPEELSSFFYFMVHPEVLDAGTGEMMIITDCYLFPVITALILLCIMTLLMIIYTAMTLGQMALRNRQAISIGLGAAMYAVLTVIGVKAGHRMDKFFQEPTLNNLELVQKSLLISLPILILVIAGLYLINVRVLNKHLNLE